MRVRVIAVGTRMPRWVREGFEDYAGRLAASLKLSLVEIEPGPRGAGRPAQQAVAAEAKKLSATLRTGEYVVALDERGKELTTRELSAWLAARLQDGRDVAFLIGGPDGLAPSVLERCDLKRGLVRVVLAEQLYRAHTVLNNHPYHRD
jgi:23S rRNA (pseudouridine1915-N3)-methyltransferase